MGLVKTLNIPTYILNFFNLQENLELLEYIIAGIFGLVSRLGFKGLIEGIFMDNYAKKIKNKARAVFLLASSKNIG